MKKVLYLLLIGFLMFSLAACASSDSSKIIEFNDEALESMIRTAMNRPEGDVLMSDAQEVAELDFRMDGNDWSLPRIKNLDALKYFTNLTYLDLSWALQNESNGYDDVDISALSALTNLEYLQIACVNLSDIRALSEMVSLKGLALWGCERIDDLSPLAKLTNLEALELKNNAITDLKPLEGLTKLNYLDVSDNFISDISPLAGLTSLANLYLVDNPIRDYSSLSGMHSNLEEADFEPLAQPQPIDFKDAVLEEKIRKALNIPQGDITINDTEPITELGLGHEWQEFIPEEEKIVNIDALKYFPNLFKLDLFFNNIEWINSIRALPNLGILNLSNNKISDITAISDCSNLLILSLSNCNCNTEQLAILAGFPRLESLDLSYSPNIGSVEVLSGMTNLKALYLKGTMIDDVSPLVGLSNLNTLYLAEPIIDKFEPDYSVLKDIYPNLTEKNFEI